MNRLLYGVFLFLSSLLSLSAQPELGPSIGVGQLPATSDQVCDIPIFLDNFVFTGMEEGEIIPDFNLFDIDGNEIIMSEILGQGKPVLMVAGSYTCWVFREKIAVLNDLVQAYNSDIEIFIVYTVEAHPVSDVSPYFGYEAVGAVNIWENILYQQPDTYGQRRAIVSDLLANHEIDVPVYIDGPCNNWWETFGPAPNIGYLIDTDGTILAKEPWFDKHPWDIECDLETHLGLDTGCGNSGQNGSFSFIEISAQDVQGPAGTTLYATGEIINDSDEGVEIEITKLSQEMPGNWENSICTDVCYPASQQSALVFVEPGSTLNYTQYFYTDETPAAGFVRVGFRNTADEYNSYSVLFSGETYISTSVANPLEEENQILVYPNPVAAGQEIVIDRFTEQEDLLWFLYDAKGQQVQTQQIGKQQTRITSDNLPTGLYYYRIQSNQGLATSGKLFIQ